MEEDKEISDVKFFRELLDYFNAYMYGVIDEIFSGTGMALGLSEKKAYDLAKNKPESLQKAGFFKSILDRFKNIFKHSAKKFRPKKVNIKDASPEQWNTFNDYLRKYWQANTQKVVEDVTVKGFLSGMDTNEFRKKKKPYKNKSLYQIDFDQYDGKMPETIEQAYKKYDFSNSEKKALNKSFNSIAMYVSNTNNEIQEAIREQVKKGIESNKSATEIASDLYWNVEKDENLTNKYTAETLRRNWNRVSSTELANIYNSGALAPDEAEAVKSLKDPKKAKYYVRTGGTCPWCRSKQGTLVRLVPQDIVQDSKNESLKSMGIKDPNTDIAIWIGKNNVGLKQPDWKIACPAHPHNVAEFSPINIETEYYNPKSGKVELRPTKKKFVPQQLDYTYRSKEESEYKKPKFVGDNLVRMGDNVYESVSPDEYNKKLEKWKDDRTLPIPVNRSGPQYIRIFEEAGKS